MGKSTQKLINRTTFFIFHITFLFFTEKKTIAEIDCAGDGSSLSILDVEQDFIACAKSSVIKPHQLLVGRIDSETLSSGKLTLTECSEVLNILEGEDLMYEHSDIVLSNSEDAVSKFAVFFPRYFIIVYLIFIKI